MSAVKPLLVRMPLQLHRSLAKAAKEVDLSMAHWVRQAIREKLAR